MENLNLARREGKIEREVYSRLLKEYEERLADLRSKIQKLPKVVEVSEPQRITRSGSNAGKLVFSGLATVVLLLLSIAGVFLQAVVIWIMLMFIVWWVL